MIEQPPQNDEITGKTEFDHTQFYSTPTEKQEYAHERKAKENQYAGQVVDSRQASPLRFEMHDGNIMMDQYGRI